jgi:hypothetical protein
LPLFDEGDGSAVIGAVLRATEPSSPTLDAGAATVSPAVGLSCIRGMPKTTVHAATSTRVLAAIRPIDV